MKYTLVFRNNGFVGLYDIEKKEQIFNIAPDLLGNRLKMEIGETPCDMNIVIEGKERVNPLNLLTIEEWLIK